jgi:hypothetical protein
LALKIEIVGLDTEAIIKIYVLVLGKLKFFFRKKFVPRIVDFHNQIVELSCCADIIFK